METQKFSVEWRDTDFLCVGGGIAGLMAAINAAEQGMDCVVLEKADTRRSGSGGLGNDHFICYIPEVHGDYATLHQRYHEASERRSAAPDGAGMGEVFLHENLGHRAPVGRVGHSHEA